MTEFKGFPTPKFRDMTDDEYDSFDLPRLKYSACCSVPSTEGKRFEPFFEGDDIVWAAATKEDSPTFRFYNCGTNDLRIFVYKPNDDKWFCIKSGDLPPNSFNLHGILHKMGWKIKQLCLENERLKNPPASSHNVETSYKDEVKG